MKSFLVILAVLSLAACSSKVIVKKDTCKDIFDGALMECEQVTK